MHSPQVNPQPAKIMHVEPQPLKARNEERKTEQEKNRKTKIKIIVVVIAFSNIPSRNFISLHFIGPFLLCITCGR